MSTPTQSTHNIDKALLTNLIALGTILIGFISPYFSNSIKSVGFFALSGAVTNWLAVHMLFEKIPFLYGSGVIPNQFQQFRTAIKQLIMKQFFTYENIVRFFEKAEKGGSQAGEKSIIDNINFDKVFNGFVDAILKSPVGNMVGMFGGTAILDTIKEPVIENLRKTVHDIVTNDLVKAGVSANEAVTQVLIDKIESIVDHRLNELTPQMVKIIVQEMIKQHLGWLVVWGGVFGGAIGLLVSFIP